MRPVYISSTQLQDWVGPYAFIYALPIVKVLACAVGFPSFIRFNSLGTFLQMKMSHEQVYHGTGVMN